MSRFTPVVRWLGRQRWFAAVGRLMVPVDRWLLQNTRGRWNAGDRHGPPTLLLTTIGRRTGQERTPPLQYNPDGDSFVVVGSNWGQERHPAWSANLLANNDATVTIKGTRIPVRAVLATDGERDRLWRMVTEKWPAYRAYADRAQGRDLRVFRLDPR